MERINPLCMPFPWFFPHLKKCNAYFPSLIFIHRDPRLGTPVSDLHRLVLSNSQGVQGTAIKTDGGASVLVNLKDVLSEPLEPETRRQRLSHDSNSVLGYERGKHCCLLLLHRESQLSLGHSRCTMLLPWNKASAPLLVQLQKSHLAKDHACCSLAIPWHTAPTRLYTAPQWQ